MIKDQNRIRLAVLEAQVELLSEQLTKTETRLEKTETVLQEEKEDRRGKDAEVAEQTINFQKMVQFLQQDNQHLLDIPNSSKFDVANAANDVEDPVEVSTPPAAPTAKPMEYAPRSSSWGIGLGAVTAAAVFYMVAMSEHGSRWFPTMQEKARGALHLTDAESIVPHSFEESELR
jgi:DNA-binding protein H-NS